MRAVKKSAVIGVKCYRAMSLHIGSLKSIFNIYIVSHGNDLDLGPAFLKCYCWRGSAIMVMSISEFSESPRQDLYTQPLCSVLHPTRTPSEMCVSPDIGGALSSKSASAYEMSMPAAQAAFSPQTRVTFNCFKTLATASHPHKTTERHNGMLLPRTQTPHAASSQPDTGSTENKQVFNRRCGRRGC